MAKGKGATMAKKRKTRTQHAQAENLSSDSWRPEDQKTPVPRAPDNQETLSPRRIMQIVDNLTKVYAIKFSMSSSLTSSRRVSKSAEDETAAMLGATKGNVRASKAVWKTDDPRLKPVIDARNKLRRYVLDNTFPYPPMPAVSIVKIYAPDDEMLNELEERIQREGGENAEKYNAVPVAERRQWLINFDKERQYARFLDDVARRTREMELSLQEFNTVYFRATVEERRRELGPLFDPADYGNELVMSATLDFVDVLPSQFTSINSQEIKQIILAKMTENVKQATTELIDKLATELMDSMASLAERMSGSEDGKPKTFKLTRLNTINEQVQLFRESLTPLGMTTGKLDEAMQKLETLLNTDATPESLNNARMEGEIGDRVRQRVTRAAESVFEALNESLIDRPRRVFKNVVANFEQQTERRKEAQDSKVS